MSFVMPMPNHVFAREIRNTQILGRMCERAMYQRPVPHGPLEDDPCVDFIIKKFDLQGDDDMPTIIRKMAAARAAEAAEAARADFLPPLEFFDSGVPLPPLEFSDSTASAAVNKNFESTASAVTSAVSVDEFQGTSPGTPAAKRPKIAVADEFQGTCPKTSASALAHQRIGCPERRVFKARQGHHHQHAVTQGARAGHARIRLIGGEGVGGE